MAASQTILITSALPYVNNVPHLGNIIGCVLPGDVCARYYRSKGLKVLYVCGADEYGTATEVKAREEGVSPRDLCDKYYALHKKIYDWFNIQFDIFGRTSTPNPRTDDHFHTKISQQIFSQLYHNGFLEEREVVQLYCSEISRFVADRFVVGTCPKCGDDKARGDQCDKCQAVYESVELINPHLKGNINAKLEPRSSKHLFLCLDKLQPQIAEWANKSESEWAGNAISVTRSWLEQGLKPRCITRDMEWGTPLPDDVPLENKESKVMYNWFDAPIGYISIAGPENLHLWKNPDKVRLIQFMGIDNVPFHSILFPGSLIGTGDKYTLVSEIASCHYLNYEGGKFSKTDNRGIFGDEVMTMGISPDYWRYYLMKIRPEDYSVAYQRSDANFTWDDFTNTCNADLVKNYGNLVHRVFDLVHKYGGGAIDRDGFKMDSEFESKMSKLIEHCEWDYEHRRIHGAICTAIELSSITNKFLTDTAPWKLHAKNPQDPQIIASVGTALTAVWSITKMLEPVIPESAAKILSFMEEDSSILRVKSGFYPFFRAIKVNIPIKS